MDDEIFMKEALKEAQAALEEDEIPIGAVVAWRGRVIAKGHNMTEKLHDATAHAEMIAITAATEALGANTSTSAPCTSQSSHVPCAPAQ